MGRILLDGGSTAQDSTLGITKNVRIDRALLGKVGIAVDVGISSIADVEPAGAVVTDDVTGEVQDVTKVGVVGVTIVDADIDTAEVAGEVSGNGGVSATPDGAVAVDHSADESVGGVGLGISGAAAVAQSLSTGSGAGDSGGADVDAVVGEEVIGAEKLKTGFTHSTVGGISSGVAALHTGAAGELVIVAGAVKLQGSSELFQVTGAVAATGALTSLLQSGQEHSGEDRDDGDHDEEFDQSELFVY